MSLLATHPNHGVKVALQYTSIYIEVLYTVIPNIERQQETKEDKLRSILSQLEYKYQVIQHDCNGIPYRTHIYVPEIYPITLMEFHEREDDAHVLKVRTFTCIRTLNVCMYYSCSCNYFVLCCHLEPAPQLALCLSKIGC